MFYSWRLRKCWNGILLLVLLGNVVACTTGTKLTKAQETLRPGEEQEAIALFETMKERINAKFKNKAVMKRDAHPRHHGCVKAEFVVEEGLRDGLKVGVFAGERYPACVRFSNGLSNRGDADNVQGLAIKLMEVPGEKLLKVKKGRVEIDPPTQDFLLISHEVMVVKNGADFHQMTKALNGGSLEKLLFFFNPFDLHLKEFSIANATTKTVANVLEIEYFSTTPYLLGEGQAVKYKVEPCAGVNNSEPKNPSPGYLREVMSQYLKNNGACFSFLVQVQNDPDEDLIEDPRYEWKSDFEKVATLHIPTQRLDNPNQMDTCENISLTPWHSLPQHRPLGNINRTRKIVYQGISKFRHERNKVLPIEPLSITPDWKMTEE